MRTALSISLAALLWAATSTTHAVLVFTIDRQSDTVATVSVTGTLDTLAPFIYLNDALAGPGNSGTDGFVLDMPPLTIGGGSPVSVGGETTLDFGMLGPTFMTGAASGSLTVNLSGGTEIWASAGSSGNVFTGLDGMGANIGTWTVVPIPAAAWLFGTGLLSLAGIMHRRQA